MSAASRARRAPAEREERHSMVVPRGHASAENPEPLDSAADFLSVPSRTLVMPEGVSASDFAEPQSDAKTVVEREEWIRARHQIALIVRSTVAEAILPLQESIASIAERLDVLASAERVAPAPLRPPPPQARATMLPPPLAHRIDVSPMQQAAVLLERVAAVLDERVAAELAKTSMLTELVSSPDDDPSS